MPQNTADVVPLVPSGPVRAPSDPIRARLDDLLTRAFYSAAGYVFESDPFVVAGDSDVLALLTSIREDDRRHAHVLGTLIQSRGAVPQPGVFPWWNLDLNYLTVPCLARFVVDTLDEELSLYASLLDAWPHDDPAGRATVDWVRTDKAEHLARLRPAAEAALVREAEAYRADAATLRTKRAAKQAKAKAAAEAAKKAKAAAKAPAGAKPTAAPVVAAGPVLRDPKEPGISPKERGRRTVLQSRSARGLPLSRLAGASPAASPGAAVAAAGGAAPAFPGAVPPAAGGPLPDPNEPGITPKEKARRQMLKLRAAAGAPSAGPAPGPAAGAAPIAGGGGGAPPPADVELLDPNEPGLTPKEKARRQMLKMRASQGGTTSAMPTSSGVAPAPAAAPPPPAAAAAPAGPAVPDDLGDPDEPGLSPKERGRRQVVRNRRKAAGL